MRTRLLLLSSLTLAFQTAGAVTTITSGSPGTPVGTLGANLTGDFPTWGQTVTAPAGEDKIDSFSFWIGVTSATLDVIPYVAQWDGSQNAIGAILHTGSTVSLPGSGGALREIEFTIPGVVSVTPGSSYILFVSTLDAGATVPQFASVGVHNLNSTGTDLYTDGIQRISNENNGGSSIAALSNANSWANTPSGQDLAFTATFSTVPEPAAVTLLTAGLGGLLLRRSRRA